MDSMLRSFSVNGGNWSHLYKFELIKERQEIGEAAWRHIDDWTSFENLKCDDSVELVSICEYDLEHHLLPHLLTGYAGLPFRQLNCSVNSHQLSNCDYDLHHFISFFL
jgi:hypothetical protein